ncbi:MAG: fused MFS/spermidine synthase [Rhodospirillales bacterium]|nr:fused MFS/spermidine synthase [Rhodospirillales bacterium]
MEIGHHGVSDSVAFGSRRSGILLSVYVLAIFLGALLMFWSEMLIGKIVLPLLGGTPMVWTTCMVYFQALLLAGYAYAHWTMRIGLRRQIFLYLAVIALSFPLLPINVDTEHLKLLDTDPRILLIVSLSLGIGVPFFILSVAGPMLQAWFAHSRHPDAANPYFLYAASNAGSLIGLLGFPVLAEPQLNLMQQSGVWSWVYAAFAGLILLAALMVRESSVPAVVPKAEVFPATHPRTSDRVRWTLLAFAPSSLLLGLTTLITTDIAAVPLIWMLPLAAYLISFMIVFARRPLFPHWAVLILHPITVLPPLFFWYWEISGQTYLMFGLHFVAFFMTALVCHGELARRRPDPRHLTEFYLFLSLGGMLGGFFNLVVAPLIFSRILEYPLAMVLALALRPLPEQTDQRNRRLDLFVPVGWLGILLAVLVFHREEIIPQEVEVIVILSLLMGQFAIVAQKRTVRFSLMAGGLVIANLIVPPYDEKTVFAERNFFGVLRVVDDESNSVRKIYHGTTLHGAQHTDSRRLSPVSYYSEDGPVGQIFGMVEIDRADAAVGVVGLGAGSIACHARKGQRVTFFEIDSAVTRVASDPKYFTFFRDCPAKADVVLGDGRLMLAKAPVNSLNLIVFDAFSSDAIPVHFLTREAFALYRTRLKEGGIMLFHISSRYLDLTRVLAPLSESAGLKAYVNNYQPPLNGISEEIMDADWVVVVPPGPIAEIFDMDEKWTRLKVGPNMPEWTDSFSNLLSIIR